MGVASKSAILPDVEYSFFVPPSISYSKGDITFLITPKPKGLEFFRQTDSRAPINRGWAAVFPLRRDVPQYAAL